MCEGTGREEGSYQEAVHERDVLQAGLGRLLLRDHHRQPRLLLLHVPLQPLDVPVHRLQPVPQLGELLLLELLHGHPGGGGGVEGEQEEEGEERKRHGRTDERRGEDRRGEMEVRRTPPLRPGHYLCL